MMAKELEYMFLFLVFPGLLFSGIMGFFVGWLDRKLTARLQWRVGPPWYQNFADFMKLLLYKETLIPEGASKAMFLGMPLLGLTAASLASTIVLLGSVSGGRTFVGDLIVIVYLLMMPSMALMLGGFASGNPLASLGASREMKLMLSYELPFILALAVPVIKSGYTIKLGDIINFQSTHGPIVGSASGLLSFLVMMVSIQAKLGLVPFDMAEAETEIISGPCIEYSGKALAIFKLSKSIMAFAIPVLVMDLYFGGIKPAPGDFAKNIFEYLLILILMIVMKNTNPRLRIDHAVRFFWGGVTSLAIIGVILSSLGW